MLEHFGYMSVLNPVWKFLRAIAMSYSSPPATNSTIPGPGTQFTHRTYILWMAGFAEEMCSIWLEVFLLMIPTIHVDGHLSNSQICFGLRVEGCAKPAWRLEVGSLSQRMGSLFKVHVPKPTSWIRNFICRAQQICIFNKFLCVVRFGNLFRGLKRARVS